MCALRWNTRQERLEVLANGKPAEQFSLFTTRGGGRSSETLDRALDEVGNVGRLLLPDSEFGIRVESEGFSVAEAGPFDPEHAPESLRIELHARSSVAGRPLMS